MCCSNTSRALTEKLCHLELVFNRNHTVFRNKEKLTSVFYVLQINWLGSVWIFPYINESLVNIEQARSLRVIIYLISIKKCVTIHDI